MATPDTCQPATVPASSWRADLVSGFLVFLIALPLCLGISIASGYPPVAGLFTAIIGGLVCTFLSDSQLTIKGPAAGLIVIAVGAIQAFGGGLDKSRAENYQAYQLALAVGAAAGALQIVMGLLKAGKLTDFFPLTVVHGMLASIGIIIVTKQIHVMLGVSTPWNPHFHPLSFLHLESESLQPLLAIPSSFRNLNPEVALIGFLALAVLFGLPLVRSRWVKMVPAPMVVLLLAVPLGFFFDLQHRHTYRFLEHDYVLGPTFLVSLPENLLAGVTTPNFTSLLTWAGWKFVFLFAMIGSLESLLSARAIDLIDPYRRKTGLNRDLLAIGVANTASAFVGGLPMISEIVRSGANVNNGAVRRWANFFHGLFLLGFLVFLPGLIKQIPLAALAAMLVYTGYRLAAPQEFVRVLQVGRGQLVVFLATIAATILTDLLIGLAVGVIVEFLVHWLSGAPLWTLLMPMVKVGDVPGKPKVIAVGGAAVFSTWLPLRRRIDQQPPDADLIIDLSATWLVDHTVMEKLHDVRKEFAARGRSLQITGLETHQKVSDHPHAARRRVLAHAV